jgi:hypothetical protein
LHQLIDGGLESQDNQTKLRQSARNTSSITRVRRLLRPNPMPPEWQSWQRNVADRYPTPIGGDGLAALSVTGGDLEAAR